MDTNSGERSPKKSVSSQDSAGSRKLTKDKLLGEPHRGIREFFASELTSAISHFIEQGLPVCLEGFGLLLPELHAEQNTYTHGTMAQSCVAQVRSISFEKCFVILPSHRERFPRLIETRQLVDALYPKLSEPLQVEWNARDFRRALRLFIEIVRDEVVTEGHSQVFGALGEFFALHNRQGGNASEWYAGADIFIVPKLRRVLREECRRHFERPILESPWEILEAAFGAPVRTFSIDLASELRELGFAIDELPPDLVGSVNIAEFIDAGEKNSSNRIYCTNGARHFGLRAAEGRGYGNEFIVQLPAHSTEGVLDDLFTATMSPVRLLVGAWLLMLSAKSRTANRGAGISLDLPLFKESDSDLRTVMALPFQRMRSEQLSREGPFYFMNIIGITDDEAEFAAQNSPEILLTLLRRRSLDTVTTPWRPGILARTKIGREREASHDNGKSSSSSLPL